jgi:hypothetical protein
MREPREPEALLTDDGVLIIGDGYEINANGTVAWDPTPVIIQLTRAGLLPYLYPEMNSQGVVRGWVVPLDVLPNCLAKLMGDTERFALGGLHHLHPEVGEHRWDFRSYRGTFGPGSLQLVVDYQTGRFYADIDLWNPYQDVVNWIGHSAEVVGPRLKRLGGWLARPFRRG